MELWRYAELLGFNECSLRGVLPSPEPTTECYRIWDDQERRMLMSALRVAQSKIEQFLHFPLSPKFVCDELLRWQNRRGIIGPTRWRHVRALGIEGLTSIADAVTITLSDGTIHDPVVITVNGVTVTELCEVALFHVAAKGGGEIELDEEHEVSISGGVLTITIPRCRLVDPTVPMPKNGYAYNLDSNFVTSVDVKRRYVDTSEVASLVYEPWAQVCLEGCDANEQDACGYIMDGIMGQIRVWPGAYSEGAWVQSTFMGCCYPNKVKLNYLANYGAECAASGLCTEVPTALEMAVIRLAHAEMPYAPCGCSIHDLMYKSDMEFPDPAPPDSMNPFGSRLGQLYAWRTTKMYSLGEGGLL